MNKAGELAALEMRLHRELKLPQQHHLFVQVQPLGAQIGGGAEARMPFEGSGGVHGCARIV